jgi:hypothetical protein
MRVSIINCVSTAAKMMRFSDASLLSRPGHINFDYVIVKWLASPAVEKYLEELPEIIRNFGHPDAISVHVIEHKTDSSVGYVPNLRAMMNRGFDHGFCLNEYAGLVNTDCYFGPNWLRGLAKYVQPNRVINSLHITAATAPKPVAGILTEDLGPPLPGRFKSLRFVRLYDTHYKDDLILARQLNTENGYRECATMPYLFHERFWHQCGPWELECVNGQSPDVRFFDRVAEAGAEFALTHSSIVYHHEAVERRGKRPKGAEHLREH